MDKNELRESVIRQAQHIAEYLDGRWTVTPCPYEHIAGADLQDMEGAHLYIGTVSEGYGQPITKLHIKGELPKNIKGEEPYVEGYGQFGKRMPSINVSRSKTAAQIAADIERRLLPEYLEILALAQQRVAESNTYYNKTESMAAQIAKLIEADPSDLRGNKVHFYHSPFPIFQESLGDAEVSDDDVKLTLRLSHENTLKILRYLIAL